MLITIIVILLMWAIAVKKLSGQNLDHFDGTDVIPFPDHEDDKRATNEFLLTINTVRQNAHASRSIKKGFQIARDFADNLSADLESDCEFKTVVANGAKCEWAIAPKADPKRRLLFLHGGAFILGSCKGHRRYAHILSHLSRAAVLSVDYQMIPEALRMQATLDAQNAYHWVLSQGPNGSEVLDRLFVAGDSAGGNLALMLSGWSKHGAARKPDAVMAFSPSTDTTLSSETFKSNAKTDALLGQPLGLLARLPKPIRVWLSLLTLRSNPSNPLVSPIFGDLRDLPPTLIQASSSEVLLGDAVRYTNKAKAAGSDVKLQIWENQIHDWQLFNANVGSGIDAWQQVEQFLQQFD